MINHSLSTEQRKRSARTRHAELDVMGPFSKQLKTGKEPQRENDEWFGREQAPPDNSVHESRDVSIHVHRSCRRAIAFMAWDDSRYVVDAESCCTDRICEGRKARWAALSVPGIHGITANSGLRKGKTWTRWLTLLALVVVGAVNLIRILVGDPGEFVGTPLTFGLLWCHIKCVRKSFIPERAPRPD